MYYATFHSELTFENFYQRCLSPAARHRTEFKKQDFCDRGNRDREEASKQGNARGKGGGGDRKSDGGWMSGRVIFLMQQWIYLMQQPIYFWTLAPFGIEILVLMS